MGISNGTSYHNVNLIQIRMQNNVCLKNITTDIVGFDPDENQNVCHDSCIRVIDCTKITFETVTIAKTFSKLGSYGYGIAMDNIWNCTFRDVTGSGYWGIMGNNCINKALLVNCNLNRFDIHCYGADVTCINCTFRAYVNNTTHRFNRISSFFGTLYYDNCTFEDFNPLRIDSAFNIHSGFDLVLRNCNIKSGTNINYLICIPRIDSTPSIRKAFATKCFPNVLILNSDITSQSGARSNYWTIFKIDEMPTPVNIGYFNLISIFNCVNPPLNIYESNMVINFDEAIDRNISTLPADCYHLHS